MKTIKKIAGIFCALEAFTCIGIFLAEVTNLTSITKSGDAPAFVFIITSVIFVFLSLHLLRKTPEEKKQAIRKKSKKFITGTHVSGLDIGKTLVSLCLSDDGLLISAPIFKKEFNLPLNKIENLGYYNDVEVEKHLKSSFVGGVIGAASFGVTGAVIGSRPKEKQTRKVTHYLLVNYPDNQIIIESDDGVSICKMIKYFGKLKPQSNETVTIEL